MPGRRDLLWERRYATSLLAAQAGVLGPGWTTPFFASLTREGSALRFVTPEGAEAVFEDVDRIDAGGVVRHLGAFHEIARRGGEYIVTRWEPEVASVEQLRFAARGPGERSPLGSVTDATGQGIDLFYDRGGRLASLRQRLEGRGFVIEYDGQGCTGPSPSWHPTHARISS